MAGRFITIEGGEGVGKSTQIPRLAKAIRARGHDVVVTREPGGSEGAETIRKLLLQGKASRWGPRAEALLFAAARADHLDKTVHPALAAGKWVLCDRFLDSTLAYQGASGLPADELRDLHRVASAGFMPERTLLLALPATEAALRAFDRDRGRADRFGGRDAQFHASVMAAFQRLAQDEPERIRTIDAMGRPDEVTARLVEALEDLL